jgi:thymidylate kinase
MFGEMNSKKFINHFLDIYVIIIKIGEIMKAVVVEGPDNLGKSTLIKEIINKIGYHPVIHYSKPKKIAAYNFSEYEYQHSSFVNGFQLIDSKIPVIFDRFTIGEAIYSNLYRGYDGNYVWDLEKHYDIGNQLHVKLVLLTTSNWNLVKDDGLSFDYSRRQEEQEMFIEAFNKSIIPNKFLVDINKNGIRKSAVEILEEIEI